MTDQRDSAVNADIFTFLAAISPPESEGFLETRHLRKGTVVRQDFYPVVGKRLAFAADMDHVGRDVFVGVAPRSREEGTRDAVSKAWTAWIDLDTPEAAERLETFEPRPALVVSSGTQGHLHAYWPLVEAAEPAVIERINRALAERLGGDTAACDAARTMRLPGTWNCKHDPPVKAELVEADDRRFQLIELEAAVMEAVEADATSRGPEPARAEVSEPVRAVLAELEGVTETGNGWTALCPAHDDHHPSLSVAVADDGRCLLHCFAGCPPDDVVGELGLTLSDLYATAAPAKKSSTRLLQLADKAGIEVFHTPQGVGHAAVAVGTHRETWPLRSAGFGLWLRRLQYEAVGEALSEDVLGEAVATLEARALFAGEEREVHRRVAGVGERILVDLGDPDWRTIEITDEGWEVVEDHHVHFVRDSSALALPVPERGGSIEDLREFANCVDEGSWMRLCGFLVMCLNPCGPYPLAYPTGEQGSAKSTVSRLICSLVDPRVAPLMMGNPSTRDLAVISNSVWLVGFDNVSKVSTGLSDALCQLATGGGYRTRQLYTDSETLVLDLKRPVLLNGIGRVISRPDLLDRVALIELAPIPPERRRTEEELNAAWEKARPRILGALLDGVSAALAESDNVELEDFPRMADFARWGEAAGGAFGWHPGAFTSSLEGSRQELLEGSAEAHAEIAALLSFMEKRREWDGSATDLLKALTAAADEAVSSTRDWPKRPDILSLRLVQHAPLLRTHGLEVKRGRAGGGNRPRFIQIRRERDAGTRGDA